MGHSNAPLSFSLAQNRYNRRMAKRIGMLIWILACGMILTWSWWPIPREMLTLRVAANQMTLESAEGESNPRGLIHPRQIILLFPASMRLGEAFSLRLEFSPDPLANPDPTLADIFDTHTVLAAARLEMAGMRLAPQSAGWEVTQPLAPGKSAIFSWTLTPLEGGSTEGIAWLTLQCIPADGGAETERVLSAQRFTIRVYSLLGLPVGFLRAIGITGLGAALLAWLFYSTSSRPQRKR
jgi:hypothetical protein